LTFRLQENVEEDTAIMAKCAQCGKATTFGHNRSFSMRATRRKFEPNLQRVRIMEGGRLVQKTLCTKCIKRLARA
jgi:large subunit ribosomal protein L28